MGVGFKYTLIHEYTAYTRTYQDETLLVTQNLTYIYIYIYIYIHIYTYTLIRFYREIHVCPSILVNSTNYHLFLPNFLIIFIVSYLFLSSLVRNGCQTICFLFVPTLKLIICNGIDAFGIVWPSWDIPKMQQFKYMSLWSTSSKWMTLAFT